MKRGIVPCDGTKACPNGCGFVSRAKRAKDRYHSIHDHLKKGCPKDPHPEWKAGHRWRLEG